MMDKIQAIIDDALARGDKSLSEYESKQIISAYGVKITREIVASDYSQAIGYAENEIGYPIVMKGVSRSLSHKTEYNMVKLGITDEKQLRLAYDEITGKGIELDGVLVQEMIKGAREFVIGMIRDQQFGPAVMFGVGGIFTEIYEDVAFRVAPLTERDSQALLDEIRAAKLLKGFREAPEVDIYLLKKYLTGIGQLALDYSSIAEIDINPLIVSGSTPIAVDALIVLKENNS